MFYFPGIKGATELGAQSVLFQFESFYIMVCINQPNGHGKYQEKTTMHRWFRTGITELQLRIYIR